MNPIRSSKLLKRGNNDFSWNLINLLNVTNAMKGSRRRNIYESIKLKYILTN
jgi:hypothetical protein